MSDRIDTHAGVTRRRASRSALLALLAAFLLPGTLLAAGNGAVAVRGTQLAYGTCGDLGDGYEMTGDLVGCWWITTFESKTDPSKHNVRATGTELFIGWIGTRYGSFTTTFQYTAKMDGPWGNFIEIHGRCHHPIDATSDTGDLAGISGELSFKDVVNVNPPYYPYWGNVRIAGQRVTLGASAKAGAKTTAASAAAALSC